MMGDDSELKALAREGGEMTAKELILILYRNLRDTLERDGEGNLTCGQVAFTTNFRQTDKTTSVKFAVSILEIQESRASKLN